MVFVYDNKMERVGFGYAGDEVRNLLGEGVLRYRDFIVDVAQKRPEIKVSAVYHDNIIYRGVLNIRLEGELSELESVMGEFFSEFGPPDVVDTPACFMDKIPPRRLSVTTKPAYSLVKTLLKEEGIKLAKLMGGTAVRKECAPSF